MFAVASQTTVITPSVVRGAYSPDAAVRATIPRTPTPMVTVVSLRGLMLPIPWKNLMDTT